MKTEKLSLKSIKNALSRAELKEIMAGSTGTNGCLNQGACTASGGACGDAGCHCNRIDFEDGSGGWFCG